MNILRILFLIVLAVLCLSSPSLTAAEPTATATFECIGLYWKAAKGSESTECTVRYRKTGSSTWREALPLWYDKRNKEYRGSIVGLKPGTTYEVKLALKGNGESASLQAATWSETFPVARTVDLAGKSGDIVITEGGKPDGYVLYQGGKDRVLKSVKVNASHVILRGLTIKGATVHGIELGDVHHVVIEYCDISGWGRKDKAGFGANYNAGVYSKSKKLQCVVIQRNRLHHPRYSSNNWTQQRLSDKVKPTKFKGEDFRNHPMGPQAVAWSGNRGNHVIRYNDIYSDEKLCWNDGLGGWDNFGKVGFPGPDTDIQGNTIRNAFDDGVEAEGGGCNVRIWGNYFDLVHQSVATVAVTKGPLYVFRNILRRTRCTPDGRRHDASRSLGKVGSHGRWRGNWYGRQYWFHNTILQPPSGSVNGVHMGSNRGIGATSDGITELISRNNILHVHGRHKLYYGRGKERSHSVSERGYSIIDDYKRRGRCSFDYDLYNGEIAFPGPDIEKHGIQGVPRYALGHGWENGAGGKYQLAPGSPGRDAGIRIPNFNDGFTGKAPDIGAHEAGSPLMTFGVSARMARGDDKAGNQDSAPSEPSQSKDKSPARTDEGNTMLEAGDQAEGDKSRGKERPAKGELDLAAYQLELVISENFSKDVKMLPEKQLLDGKKRVALPKGAEWVLEGAGHARQENGRLIISNHHEKKAKSSHMVLWNNREVPGDFLLEFEMFPKDSKRGLAIIFFSARGRDGKDIFALNKAPREGEFSRYHSGDINCYHVSYWAVEPKTLKPRGFSNLRKNRGFKKVASGKDLISDEGRGPHRVRLLKVDGTITLETRGKIALTWQDDGKEHGPVLGSGKIGLRTMSHTGEVAYDSFKVWKVLPKR